MLPRQRFSTLGVHPAVREWQLTTDPTSQKVRLATWEKVHWTSPEWQRAVFPLARHDLAAAHWPPQDSILIVLSRLMPPPGISPEQRADWGADWTNLARKTLSDRKSFPCILKNALRTEPSPTRRGDLIAWILSHARQLDYETLGVIETIAAELEPEQRAELGRRVHARLCEANPKDNLFALSQTWLRLEPAPGAWAEPAAGLVATTHNPSVIAILATYTPPPEKRAPLVAAWETRLTQPPPPLPANNSYMERNRYYQQVTTFLQALKALLRLETTPGERLPLVMKLLREAPGWFDPGMEEVLDYPPPETATDPRYRIWRRGLQRAWKPYRHTLAFLDWQLRHEVRPGAALPLVLHHLQHRHPDRAESERLRVLACYRLPPDPEFAPARERLSVAWEDYARRLPPTLAGRARQVAAQHRPDTGNPPERPAPRTKAPDTTPQPTPEELASRVETFVQENSPRDARRQHRTSWELAQRLGASGCQTLTPEERACLRQARLKLAAWTRGGAYLKEYLWKQLVADPDMDVAAALIRGLTGKDPLPGAVLFAMAGFVPEDEPTAMHLWAAWQPFLNGEKCAEWERRYVSWTRFRWVLPPAGDAAERALVRLLDRFPDALLPRVVEGILHGPPALRNFVAGWIPETASRRQALCAAWKTRLQQEPHDPAAWLALRLLDPSAAKAMWATAVAAAGTLHEWKFLMRQTPESISGAEFYAVWKPHLPRLPWTLRRVFWQVSLTDPPGGTAWEDHLCETIRTESSVRVLEVLAAGVHASTSSPILLPVWKRRLAEQRIRPVARRALRNILQHGCPLPESSGLVWTQWQQSWSREDADYRELLTYHLLDNWGKEAPVPETFPPENLWMPAVFRTLHANGPAPDDWQPFTLGESTPPDPEWQTAEAAIFDRFRQDAATAHWNHIRQTFVVAAWLSHTARLAANPDLRQRYIARLPNGTDDLSPERLQTQARAIADGLYGRNTHPLPPGGESGSRERRHPFFDAERFLMAWIHEVETGRREASGDDPASPLTLYITTLQRLFRHPEIILPSTTETELMRYAFLVAARAAAQWPIRQEPAAGTGRELVQPIIFEHFRITRVAWRPPRHFLIAGDQNWSEAGTLEPVTVRTAFLYDPFHPERSRRLEAPSPETAYNRQLNPSNFYKRLRDVLWNGQ
jgi:hypothetical protein